MIWSTDEEPDSVFSFVQSGTGLIKGALELYPLLQEGDEVVAIMPDSIAYGSKGVGQYLPVLLLCLTLLK